MWQFAAVVQFLTTFGQELMPQYEHPSSTETIEDALLSGRENFFLKNLHVHLLRLVTGAKFINEETCWQWYQRVFEERQPVDELTKFQDFFHDLTAKQKVVGLNYLCELLLDDVDWFRLKLKDPEEQEFWRVDPVGYDAQQNTYWLFDDNRLYVEKYQDENDSPEVKSDKSSESPQSARKSRRGKDDRSPAKNADVHYDHDWQLVCDSIEDWQTFPLKFETSRNRYEKALFKSLSNDIGPKVLSHLLEKQKERELEEALYNRKRSSRLVVRELEVMEMQRQEDLRRAEQEAIAAARRAELSSRRDEIHKQRDEEERIFRLKDREERVRKREEAIAKRRQEEELKKAKEESLKAIKEKMNIKKEGKESWRFRCYCGVKGKNLDDGLPMLSCERCDTWFHISCVDERLKKKRVPPKNWQLDDYLCDRCVNADKRAEAQKRAENIRNTQILNQQNDEDIDVVGDGDDLHHKAKIPKVKLTSSQQPQSNGISFAPQQPFMSPQQAMANSSPFQQGQFYIQPPVPWFYAQHQQGLYNTINNQHGTHTTMNHQQNPSAVLPISHAPGPSYMSIPATHNISGQYIMPMIAAQQHYVPNLHIMPANGSTIPVQHVTQSNDVAHHQPPMLSTVHNHTGGTETVNNSVLLSGVEYVDVKQNPHVETVQAAAPCESVAVPTKEPPPNSDTNTSSANDLPPEIPAQTLP